MRFFVYAERKVIFLQRLSGLKDRFEQLRGNYENRWQSLSSAALSLRRFGAKLVQSPVTSMLK